MRASRFLELTTLGEHAALAIATVSYVALLVFYLGAATSPTRRSSPG